jgi:hypothetical protein
MGKRSINEGASEPSESPESRELDWVVAKSLLDANARTVEAFEYHLLRTCRDDASANVETMLTNISQAIDEHERIIENLEVAAQAIAEPEPEQTVETPDA